MCPRDTQCVLPQCRIWKAISFFLFYFFLSIQPVSFFLLSLPFFLFPSIQSFFLFNYSCLFFYLFHSTIQFLFFFFSLTTFIFHPFPTFFPLTFLTFLFSSYNPTSFLTSFQFDHSIIFLSFFLTIQFPSFLFNPYISYFLPVFHHLSLSSFPSCLLPLSSIFLPPTISCFFIPSLLSFLFLTSFFYIFLFFIQS